MIKNALQSLQGLKNTQKLAQNIKNIQKTRNLNFKNRNGFLSSIKNNQQQQIIKTIKLNNYKKNQSVFNFSQQNFSAQEKEVRQVLQQIQYQNTSPDKVIQKNNTDSSKNNLIDQNVIVSTDIQQQEGKVIIKIRTNQNFRKLRQIIQDEVQNRISWVKDVVILLAPKDQSSIDESQQNSNKSSSFNKKGGLSKVKKIIAVSSCKGGVGKSTIAVNLAFSLQKLGRKVGIFDADIFGPSLPTLINREDASLYAPEDNPKSVIPIEFEGIKSMSYGYVTKDRSILRGPLVSSIVSQLVYNTEWDELDYLVVDMPPGTGDIQITLCQELSFDAAVIVTTPQRLSFVDVVKGIKMFDDLKVPTVSIVENMSSFVCEGCNHEHHPFGVGYLKMIKEQFGITNSFGIPILGKISQCSDTGKPAVLVLPEEHSVNKTYANLAQSVDEEMVRLQDLKIPVVRYQTGTQEVIVQEYGSDKVLKRMKASDLRKNCQCAICVDEFTGKTLRNDSKISDDVFPHKIEPKGNYAVAMVWSDGHKSSIYPYEKLLKMEI